MDFVTWLKRTQRREQTGVGDIARDVQADRCLPRARRSPAEVLAHIREAHAPCAAAVEAFQQARREWEAVVKALTAEAEE